VTNQGRYLHFDAVNLDPPYVVSRCSQCGQEFSVDPKPGEKMDELMLRIRADFEAHQCATQSLEDQSTS